jgi:hypothetical protein
MNPTGGAVYLPRHFILCWIPINSALPYLVIKQELVIALTVYGEAILMPHMGVSLENGTTDGRPRALVVQGQV